jgi:hypothetical protein
MLDFEAWLVHHFDRVTHWHTTMIFCAQNLGTVILANLDPVTLICLFLAWLLLHGLIFS